LGRNYRKPREKKIESHDPKPTKIQINQHMKDLKEEHRRAPRRNEKKIA
jgi:hypothetical protein